MLINSERVCRGLKFIKESSGSNSNLIKLELVNYASRIKRMKNGNSKLDLKIIIK